MQFSARKSDSLTRILNIISHFMRCGLVWRRHLCPHIFIERLFEVLQACHTPMTLEALTGQGVHPCLPGGNGRHGNQHPFIAVKRRRRSRMRSASRRMESTGIKRSPPPDAGSRRACFHDSSQCVKRLKLHDSFAA